MANDFWRLGAGGLSDAYAREEACPVQVIAELRDRIARLNHGINAYAVLAPDLEAQAEESASRLRQGRARSPLEGVPVALKDNLVMRGLPAAWGGEVFGAVQSRDELPVQRLRAAGAILTGKTTCPEFAVEGYTASRKFGITRNPWNPDLTPGGSSGGAVAAVAAGLAAAALGTDGGGSIRRPAGHTGLFGLKPTIGAIPRHGGLPQILMDFEVAGPLARSARDLRLMFGVLTGTDRSDPASRGHRPEAPARRSLKVLYVEQFGDSPCDPAIRRAARGAADLLASLGHEVTAGPLPFDLEPLDRFWGSFAQIGLAHLAVTVPAMAERASPQYLEMAANGRGIPARDLFAALEEVRRLRAAVSQAFGEWDVIMTPAAAAQPWPAGEAYPPLIDGQAAGPRGHAVYTGWVNASGHPGLAVPVQPDAAGLPVGIQLVGDLHSEDLLLSLGEEMELASSGWHWPRYALG